MNFSTILRLLTLGLSCWLGTLWSAQGQNAPTITGPSQVCAGQTATYGLNGGVECGQLDTYPNAYTTYQWNVVGGKVVGRDDLTTCDIEWTNPSGFVQLYISLYSDGGSCNVTAELDMQPATAQWGSAQGPSTPVCVYNTFSLRYVNSVHVSQVEWFRQDGATWTSLGIVPAATTDFAIQVGPSSTTTVFQAVATGECSGATDTSAPVTVAVASGTVSAGQAIGERDVSLSSTGVVTLVNYSGGDIVTWQTSVDGTNWQDTGVATETIAYKGLTMTTFYRAKLQSCSTGSFAYSSTCTLRVAASAAYNWTESTAYGADGTTLTANARQYVDLAGKPLQTQARALTAGAVLANQPLYGRYGEAVGNTLPAPVSTTDLAYDPLFVTPGSSTSTPYDYRAFDTEAKQGNPDGVNTTRTNSLGWYYSTNNLLEPYTAATAYPYSRTITAPDGSTGVTRATMPGNIFKAGAGKETLSGQFSIQNELNQYLAVRNTYFATDGSTSTSSVVPSTTGLQVWLPFTETSGTVAYDKSGNNVNGQLSGGTWQPASATHAETLKLDGSQDVHLALNGNPTEYTVSFWVNVASLSSFNSCLAAITPQSLYGVWGAFCFHTTSNGTIAAGVTAGGSNNCIVTSPGVMEINKWQHYVFTYATNGTGRLYKNGQLLSTLSNMPPPGSWTGFVVGGSSLNTDTSFQGSIGDLRIYFRAVSSQEVQGLYRGGEVAVVGAGPTSLRETATQQVVKDANGQQIIGIQDKEGHTVASLRPAENGVNAWLTTQNEVQVGFRYTFEGGNLYGASGTPVTYENFVVQGGGPIVVYNANGDVIYNGVPGSFSPSSSGDYFKITAESPFQVSRTGITVNGVYLSLASTQDAIEQTDIKSFHNFYTLAPGGIAISPLYNQSDYTLLNTAADPAQADVTASFKADPSQLPAGFYRLLINQGAVKLTYTNAYQDISYNFYDQLGLLRGSLAPNGVQKLTSSIPASITSGWLTAPTAPIAPANPAALVFDGIDDEVRINQLSGVTNTFTMEAWVLPTAPHEIDQQRTGGADGTSGQHYIIFPTHGGSWSTAGHAGAGISVGTNGVSVYEHADNYMPPVLVWQAPQPLSGWTHVAVVYQQKTPSLYINGELVKTGLTSPQDYVHPSLGFGGGPYGHFAGGVDEVRIWNTARSTSEIQTTRLAGIPAPYTNLSGYWRVDEGNGLLTHDQTTANDGTLVGFPSAVAAGGSAADLTFFTTYEYDTQGRLLATTETDAGRTEYIYRKDGKLRFSQNAKQRPQNRLSYLGYDEIGRPTEAGECETSAGFFASLRSNNAIWVENLEFGGSGLPGNFPRYDIVHTYYDVATPPTSSISLPYVGHNIATYEASFLAGRVASTARFSSGYPYRPAPSYIPVSRTWYSYDEQGRVQWQISQISENNQPARTLDYVYDALGKVISICYQKQTPTERFTHYYTYDADQRLSKVETGADDPTATGTPASVHTEQARYQYYLHGPLKRVVYNQNLQGVDYTYTAQGWLKSINDQEPARDPGGDGTTQPTKSDLFGLNLHYYTTEKDYVSRLNAGTQFYAGPASRYDGTISLVGWQTASKRGADYFQYDPKGQLQQTTHGAIGRLFNSPYLFISDGTRYREGELTYDPNGNIQRLVRTDGTGLSSLDGSYQYLPNSNKLATVNNVNSQALVSYQYDALGQMIAQQELDPTLTKYLDYDVTGKVIAVYSNATKTQVVARYTYDEAGHRLSQQVYDKAPATSFSTTYFVRDAGGRELATYIYSSTTGLTTLYEQPIYGASRLGVYRRQRDQEAPQQLYELNDNLGNTRVVFRRPQTSTYWLTMEDTGTERADFPNPSSSTYDDVRTDRYKLQGGYSMGLLNTATQRVSPGKTLSMQRGDKLTVSVYAGYPDRSGVIALRVAPRIVVGALTNQNPLITSPTEAGKPVAGWQRALSKLSLGIAFPLAKSATPLGVARPNTVTAGLQYVITRSDNGAYVDSGVKLIDADAEGKWEKLELALEITSPTYPVDVPLNVALNAYNDDGTQIVYFDNLQVDYEIGPIVEENHFYAYGQRNEGLSWTRQYLRSYGRGYQGQTTTQDAETGYTAFDLRMYDAHYGRWLAGDPMQQHFSGYMGMGNNPVSSVDPTGGEDDPPSKGTSCQVLGENTFGYQLNNVYITASPTLSQYPDLGIFYFDNHNIPNPYAPYQIPIQGLGGEVAGGLSLYNYSFALKAGFAATGNDWMFYGNIDYAGRLAKPVTTLPDKKLDYFSFSLFAATKASDNSPTDSIDPLLGASNYTNIAAGKFGLGYAQTLSQVGNTNTYQVDPNGYNIYSISYYPGKDYGVTRGQNYTPSKVLRFHNPFNTYFNYLHNSQ